MAHEIGMSVVLLSMLKNSERTSELMADISECKSDPNVLGPKSAEIMLLSGSLTPADLRNVLTRCIDENIDGEEKLAINKAALAWLDENHPEEE